MQERNKEKKIDINKLEIFQNLDNLDNNLLDLLYYLSFMTLELINQGINIHFLEKTASELINEINKIRLKRLFQKK